MFPLQSDIESHPSPNALLAALLSLLERLGLSLAVAESDTGGLLLEWLTSRPGSSGVVLGGVVAYHDRLKTHLLGLEEALLASQGAVSAAVAEAMAHGIRRLARADVGLATTGIAGPGGARPGKPVGLAYVAATDGRRTLVREYRWQADRTHNRQLSALAALSLACALLDETAPLAHAAAERSRTDVL